MARLVFAGGNATLFSGVPFASGLDVIPPWLCAESGIPNQGNLEWLVSSRVELQDQLVAWLPYCRQAAGLLEVGEGFAAAAWTAPEINAIAAAAGFGYLKLDPWTDPETFGVLGTITLDWFWKQQGTGEYHLWDQHQQGFRLDVSGSGGLRFYRTYGREAVAIPTKSGDLVYVVDGAQYCERFELLNVGASLLKGMSEVEGYSGAVLPQWKVPPTLVDVSALRGLYAYDGSGQARILDQAKFGGETDFRPDGSAFRAAFIAAARKGFSMGDTPSPNDWWPKGDVFALYVRSGMLLGISYVPKAVWATDVVIYKPQQKMIVPLQAYPGSRDTSRIRQGRDRSRGVS